jgi:DNA polymerase (family 10)
MKAFTKHGSVADVLGQGDTKSSVRLEVGLQADLRLVPEESFGAALMYFTGSKEHNIELRRIAIDKGLSLERVRAHQGARRSEGRAGRTEEEVYQRAGDGVGAPRAAREPRRDRLAAECRLPEADRARRPARRPAHAHHAQ